MTDPIDKIRWVPSRELKANWWNPNHVFNKELELLETSLLSDGWTDAIKINSNNMIIDGFHRWRLSMDSAALVRKYAEEVPCVVLDVSDREAMFRTVRYNRAKGTHAAFRMSELVQTLVDDYGATPEECISKMGMTSGEVELLYDGSLLKRHKLENYKYSNSWVPVETRRLDKETVRQIEAGKVFDV